MNKLTREILIQAAADYPELARKNDPDFRQAVREAYWERILDRYEARICARALHWWRIAAPGDFTGDGLALDHQPGFFKRTLRVYRICQRMILLKIDLDPELRLEAWETIPGTQLEMFFPPAS